MPTQEILVYERNNGNTITFEKKQDLKNGFIEAKDWLNSRSLRNGTFSKLALNSDLCRKPTQEEADYYIALKDHSIYAINAD